MHPGLTESLDRVRPTPAVARRWYHRRGEGATGRSAAARLAPWGDHSPTRNDTEGGRRRAAGGGWAHPHQGATRAGGGGEDPLSGGRPGEVAPRVDQRPGRTEVLGLRQEDDHEPRNTVGGSHLRAELTMGGSRAPDGFVLKASSGTGCLPCSIHLSRGGVGRRGGPRGVGAQRGDRQRADDAQGPREIVREALLGHFREAERPPVPLGA